MVIAGGGLFDFFKMCYNKISLVFKLKSSNWLIFLTKREVFFV